MKNYAFREYNLSQFMLGTVQFGANYGIANQAGRPSYQTVLKILECAATNGVNCLDTAPAYGDSEKIIGRAIRELGIADKMTVVTKMPVMDDNLKPAEADRLIRQGVEASLKNLQLDVLPIYLFHKESNAAYADSLLLMKEKGLVKHAGVSVNSPEWALKTVRSGNFEAIQLPTSILDQRYLKQGVFQEAKTRGIALFVRSVYVQGLLFLPENEMPAELSAVMETRRRLEQIAAKANMSLAELAACFVMSLEGASCLVMGLETLEQLQDNLKLFEQESLSAELFRNIFENVPQLPDNVIVPHLWPKRFNK